MHAVRKVPAARSVFEVESS